jgi:AraC-like DNA-binding protein
MSPLLDPFVRGLVAGGLAAFALAVGRSRAAAQVKWVTFGLAVCVVSWMVCESATMWAALGRPFFVQQVGFLASGAFWLFVLVVFEDRPLRPWAAAPIAVLAALGLGIALLPPDQSNLVGAAFNAFSGLLALHVIYVIARGWRGDLVEGRRRARAALLGVVALFVIVEVVLSFANRFDPHGGWLRFAVGNGYGAAILAVLIFAIVAVFLEARATLFDPPRRMDVRPDARAEAAERQLLQRLDAFVAEEGWRREGLTIGDLAGELETPEHRLRRLINNRLGHRNFADFLNASRIAAAQARLADPAQARTTIAAIAFDLGYGSLGPFNRAFRAATGSTPTEWRREALQASGADASPIPQTAS